MRKKKVNARDSIKYQHIKLKISKSTYQIDGEPEPIGQPAEQPAASVAFVERHRSDHLGIWTGIWTVSSTTDIALKWHSV